MAWETRTRGTRYYTRSWRVGSKVVREYVGSGVRGEVAEREEAQRRELLARQRATAATKRANWNRLENQTGDFCGASQAFIQILLQANGYRQHQRGEWRKKREEK